MSDGGYSFLKSVHTVAGAFSEIFVKSGAGSGVGRLIVSDFQKLLYSTNPEDVQLINDYVRFKHLNYVDAINHVLIDRGLYHDFTPKSGQSPYLTREQYEQFNLNRMKLEDLGLIDKQLRLMCDTRKALESMGYVYDEDGNIISSPYDNEDNEKTEEKINA